LANIFYFLLAISMVSCGLRVERVNPLQRATEAPEVFSENYKACEDGAAMISTKSSEEVFSFIKRANQFTTVYNQKFFPFIISPFHSSSGNTINSSPTNPLTVSDDILRIELQEISSEWELLVGKENTDLLSIDSDQIFSAEERAKVESIKDNIKRVNELHQKLWLLRQQSLRWSSLQCSLEELAKRAKDDVRSLFEYEKALSNPDEPIKTKVMDLCRESSREVTCLMEYKISQRKGHLSQFVEHYKSRMENRLAKFFEASPMEKWKCTTSGNVTVINIPVAYDQTLKNKLGGSFVPLRDFVNEKWSSSKVRINLTFEKEGSNLLKIKWNDSSLSVVKASEPRTIYLSKLIGYNVLHITFAHELGHILGLKDCYHEFYDKNSEEVVYYSLDPEGRNIMCNLNPRGHVPDGYFSGMAERVCL